MLWDALLHAALVGEFEMNPPPVTRPDKNGHIVDFLEDGFKGFCLVYLSTAIPFAKWLVRTGHGTRCAGRMVEIRTGHVPQLAARGGSYCRHVAHPAAVRNIGDRRRELPDKLTRHGR